MGDIYVPNMHLLSLEPFAFSNRYFNSQVEIRQEEGEEKMR